MMLIINFILRIWYVLISVLNCLFIDRLFVIGLYSIGLSLKKFFIV